MGMWCMAGIGCAVGQVRMWLWMGRGYDDVPMEFSVVGVTEPEMGPGLLSSLSVMVEVDGDREN